MKKLMVVMAMAVGLLILPLSVGFATPTLQLFDGTTAVMITDEGAGDTLPGQVGAVGFSGSIGSWIVNVTTGLTKPILGDDVNAEMDLNSVNSSGGPANLTILFSETDFVLGGATVTGVFSSELQVGGTINNDPDSSARFMAFIGASNTLFDTGVALSTLGPFGPGAFSGTAAGGSSVTEPFSLTIGARIHHTGAGVSSFDENLQGGKVPEPMSLILLGSGLAGVGLYRRMRKPKE